MKSRKSMAGVLTIAQEVPFQGYYVKGEHLAAATEAPHRSGRYSDIGIKVQQAALSLGFSSQLTPSTALHVGR